MSAKLKGEDDRTLSAWADEEVAKILPSANFSANPDLVLAKALVDAYALGALEADHFLAPKVEAALAEVRAESKRLLQEMAENRDENYVAAIVYEGVTRDCESLQAALTTLAVFANVQHSVEREHPTPDVIATWIQQAVTSDIKSLRAALVAAKIDDGERHELPCPKPLGGKCACWVSEHNAAIDRALGGT